MQIRAHKKPQKQHTLDHFLFSSYTDAFFFRVNPLKNEIEYTIADFDCIRDLSPFSSVCYSNLMNGNMDNFKTALLEYILFFVYNEKQEEYTKCVKDFR